MDVWELQVFLAIAQERSFSRAAERLFRTQPAISHVISRLEEELGEPLFDRSSKDATTLTASGNVLLEHAQSVVNTCRNAVSAIRELKDLHGGKLVIGANEYGVMYLLPAVVNFRSGHPGVKIVVKRSLASRIPSEVIAREVEIGVVSYRATESMIVSSPAAPDETVLIVHPKHRLANRDTVSIKELQGESFIAQSVHSPVRDRITELFERFHVPMNIYLELPSLETIKIAVARRVGLAFIPRLSAALEISEGKVLAVRIRELRSERRLYLLHRKGATLSHAARAFLKTMSDSR